MNTNPETTEKIPLPLYDEFLLHLQSNNYSGETLYNYERDLTTFQYFLGQEMKKSFDQLTKPDIENYKAYLLSSDRKTSLLEHSAEVKLKSGSVNRCLSSLRSYLRFLIFNDFPIPIQPESIKMVRKETKLYQLAEFNDLVRLIEAPSTLEKDSLVALRNRAMLELLFSTGMRISELLSLNKRDIDSSGKIFITGKGKKQRFVYLTDRALFHLNQYIIQRVDSSVALFVPQKGTRRGTTNCRISTNYLQAKIKLYREKLGIIVPTSAHSLRHGFATYMAENGASLAALQIMLGHASLNTTNIYINASDKFAQDTHSKYHPLSKK